MFCHFDASRFGRSARARRPCRDLPSRPSLDTSEGPRRRQRATGQPDLRKIIAAREPVTIRDVSCGAWRGFNEVSAGSQDHLRGLPGRTPSRVRSSCVQWNTRHVPHRPRRRHGHGNELKQPYPVEFVQDDDAILLRLEEYDTMRAGPSLRLRGCRVAPIPVGQRLDARSAASGQTQQPKSKRLR
jgi:hypothetical protein